MKVRKPICGNRHCAGVAVCQFVALCLASGRALGDIVEPRGLAGEVPIDWVLWLGFVNVAAALAVFALYHVVIRRVSARRFSAWGGCAVAALLAFATIICIRGCLSSGSLKPSHSPQPASRTSARQDWREKLTPPAQEEDLENGRLDRKKGEL